MEPACTSPTAGDINYAKAQCMDASKDAIVQCTINNNIYSHLI